MRQRPRNGGAFSLEPQLEGDIYRRTSAETRGEHLGLTPASPEEQPAERDSNDRKHYLPRANEAQKKHRRGQLRSVKAVNGGLDRMIKTVQPRFPDLFLKFAQDPDQTKNDKQPETHHD